MFRIVMQVRLDRGTLSGEVEQTKIRSAVQTLTVIHRREAVEADKSIQAGGLNQMFR